MTSAFSWQNSISLCPASFCIARPNFPVAAAAAAKSFQSCLTLCNPIDGSPPGSPIPGILQARNTGVTGKFGLGIQNEAGQRLIEFFQEKALVITNTSSNNTREDATHGHHQMVNTEIRLLIFFAAKDGEALYSQEKQDQELTVVQTMNSLLPNSDLN